METEMAVDPEIVLPVNIATKIVPVQTNAQNRRRVVCQVMEMVSQKETV